MYQRVNRCEQVWDLDQWVNANGSRLTKDKWKDRHADGPVSAKKPRKVKQRQKEEARHREQTDEAKQKEQIDTSGSDKGLPSNPERKVANTMID